MPTNYSPAVKTARMIAVRDAVNAGGAAGRLEICSAGYATVLATIILGFSGDLTGVVVGPTLTFAGFPRSDASIDANGTAVVARIRTSTDVDVVTGLTVGTTAADVILNHLDLSMGLPLTITAASITHA